MSCEECRERDGAVDSESQWTNNAKSKSQVPEIEMCNKLEDFEHFIMRRTDSRGVELVLWLIIANHEMCDDTASAFSIVF